MKTINHRLTQINTRIKGLYNKICVHLWLNKVLWSIREIRPIRVISVLLFISLSVAQAHAFWVWTPQTKRFVNPKLAAKQNPKLQFEYASGFYAVKDYPAAMKEFKKLLKSYPQSSYVPEAQYHLGLCLENMENYYEAYSAYQKLIDLYPASERIDEAIEREYKIAQAFIEGKKLKVLGMSMLPAKDKAIEILKKVAENSPYGQYGALAQYKLGMLYKEMGNYSDAISAMEEVVKNYPDKQIAQDARLQIADISTLYSLESDYDQSATLKAITEFDKAMKESKDQKQKQKLELQIKSLKEKEAESNFKIAKFYEKQREFASAIIYYEDIIKNFPDTGWAGKAAERLEALKKINNK